MAMSAYSLLDLSPIPLKARRRRQALANTLDLAQHAERWGYTRYWLAEHHNMPGIASAATSVVIGHVAQGTKTIRVGAGGIMLPNHAPLVIAEQFGTLDALYPRPYRSRASGARPVRIRSPPSALRRHLNESVDDFPRNVDGDCWPYFEPSEGESADPRRARRRLAACRCGFSAPALFGAQLAAMLGLPYAFASHFAPDIACWTRSTSIAIASNRRQYLQKPHVMAGFNIFAAATDEEAELSVRPRSSRASPICAAASRDRCPPPVEDIASVLSPVEIAMVDRTLAYAALVGSPETRAQGLRRVHFPHWVWTR